MTKSKRSGRAAIAAVLIAAATVVVVAPAPSAGAAPAGTDVDPCALLKPANVKAALRHAPKALRPIDVRVGVASSPSASTTQSSALGLLLRKNVGGSVQVFVSPLRKSVCPPTPATRRDRVKVAGKPVVLVRSGKQQKVRGVVFAKNGACVSVATVLSNGRPAPRAAYLALARSALRRH